MTTKLVAQSDEVINTDLPPSGSWEVHKKYLWCTPGSTTYTFFAFTDVNTTTGTAPHYVNYYRTFNQMATRLNEWNIRTPGNDPSRWLIDLAFDELNTNVRIYMKSNVGKMQYDTAQAAMTDLALAIQDSNTANVPVVFTIYDGRFGEVGTGYAGEVGAGGVQCAEDSTVASLICKEILKDGPHGGDVPVLNTEGTSLVAGISGA